jgi:hypothetical protein
MLKPTRVRHLLSSNLGSNQSVLETMNPNTKLYIVDKLPESTVEPRHLCSGIMVRELCYPVLRIGDTVWDVDWGLFEWTGKEWKSKRMEE